MSFKIFSTSMIRVLVLAALVSGNVAIAGPPTDDPIDTSVMSFNIRYGGADDGPNSWPFRRDLVFQTIARHEPAVFGVQECLWFQGEELRAAFPDYRMTGVGRDDGRQAGEMCAIFTRNDRYEVLDQGTFWLSESPEVVGSKGWDAALPRIATWVRLHDRLCEPDTLFVFNAHFDHIGEIAREKSGQLLRMRIGAIAGTDPVILMGDFNDPAAPTSPSYQALMAEDGPVGPVLHDTWLLASREQRMQGEDTFHGFSGQGTRGRIDWILVTDHFLGVDSGIERKQDNGRYPSDHFPVWATFKSPCLETFIRPRP